MCEFFFVILPIQTEVTRYSLKKMSKQNMKKKILILAIAFMSVGLGLQAQDPHFSQFYANPLYTNPALAGTAVCPRFSLSYRNQWPGLDAFKTFTASYDQYFDAISGGVGAMIMSDAQSDFYRTNTAALIYSLRLKVARDVYVNVAAQASLTNRSLDWDKFCLLYTSDAADE